MLWYLECTLRNSLYKFLREKITPKYKSLKPLQAVFIKYSLSYTGIEYKIMYL